MRLGPPGFHTWPSLSPRIWLTTETDGHAHSIRLQKPSDVPQDVACPHALIGFQGLMLHHGPRSAPPSVRPLKKKGFKEERVTTIGLDDIGTSTTLESNKSHHGMAVMPGSTEGEQRMA